jgi:hypothetical protein
VSCNDAEASGYHGRLSAAENVTWISESDHITY